jgi:hypothetical protein
MSSVLRAKYEQLKKLLIVIVILGINYIDWKTEAK